MIKIEGLNILLGGFRIMGLNIKIHEREFHSLLGPTGCGKTSILESIMGLRKPIKGKIRIGEREVQGLPPERREISYVPQDLALFPHLNVRDNILYGIKARRLDQKDYEEYVRPPDSPDEGGRSPRTHFRPTSAEGRKKGWLSSGPLPRGRNFSSWTSPFPVWTHPSKPKSSKC